MGMYDKVWVICPNCGNQVEFQSKSGDCSLNNYTLHNAPDKVLEGLLDDDYRTCETCEYTLEIIPPNRNWGVK